MKRTERPNGYHANHNIVYKCYFHITFAPKYRHKVLVGPVAVRLEEIARAVCQERGAEVVELAIQSDHVHLLVECDPTTGIGKLVGAVKGRSSRVLRQEYPHLKKMPSLWTNSCSVTTTGGAALDVVRRYIQNQGQHHHD